MHTTSENFEHAEVGRRLGWDLYRFRRAPSAALGGGAIGEGYAEARSSRVARTTADRYAAKWLQLRCSAWRRGRAVDDGVTAELIARIDVGRCPVTRLQLSHGELQDSDWSVDRLNNDGAYARNNLAVMSVRANRAKGRLSFEEVMFRSQADAATDGLLPVEWLRLAALMLGPCFANRPREAPTIPLAAPVPAYSVRLAMQQVQHVFTLHAGSQAGKNALIKHFRQACATERSRVRLDQLAEAVHAGLKGLEFANDVWLQASTMEALGAWRNALEETSWAVAGEVSRRLAGSVLVSDGRLRGWRLETRGYVRDDPLNVSGDRTPRRFEPSVQKPASGADAGA